jgi:hypothetical protein
MINGDIDSHHDYHHDYNGDNNSHPATRTDQSDEDGPLCFICHKQTLAIADK